MATVTGSGGSAKAFHVKKVGSPEVLAGCDTKAEADEVVAGRTKQASDTNSADRFEVVPK